MIKIIPLIFLFIANSIIAQEFDKSIETGSQQIEEILEKVSGKSIGIVGNQSSLVGNVHLVDTLKSLGVSIKKVFAPEHGFRGNADAGEKFDNDTDPKTGIPIISLYGRKNRTPSKEILSDIDAIVFDLQDVGVRFYTYISTMTYLMEACANHNVELIILDRPNPNGHYVDGPILKKENSSFIGMHEVPVVHGMTIGEYALMVKGEKWLESSKPLNLSVVKCKNYEHSDFYELPVAPSPNLPNMSSIYLYPSLCFFEGTNISVGRGTTLPFQQFGAPYIESSYSFTPKPSFGAKKPKRNGEVCKGYDLSSFGRLYFREYGRLYFFWIVSAYQQCDDPSTFFREDGFFHLLTGDKSIQKMIEEGKTSEEIWNSYQKDLIPFKEMRTKYLLYPDFE